MKNKENNELAVCGWAAVEMLCKNNLKSVSRLYFTKERSRDLGDACRELAKRKRPYNMVENEAELEKLSGTPHHQGAVAMIFSPKITPLTKDIAQKWIEGSESAVLLDRIGNANNLGAIVRSAAFFGLKNIILPLEESQTMITTSAYRVAQGGMEHVSFYSVKSSEKLLKDMSGKMCRIGTCLDAKTTVDKIASMRKEKPLLIVLGNEEEGICDNVKKNCDELVIIPYKNMQNGAKSAVDSLNVAQAASIIFYEAAK